MSITASVTVGGITVPNVPTLNGYELVDCGLQEITRRRDVVTSPYVNEDVEVASVRGALTYRVVIRAVGTTFAGSSALIDAVIAVAEQKTWTLVETLDGRTTTYACRAAQTISMPLDRNLTINRRREITLVVPCTEA